MSSKTNFVLYVRRITRQIHPELKLSKDACSFLNDLVHKILNKYIFLSVLFLGHSKAITILPRDLEYAVRASCVGELEKRAISIGIKAVTLMKAKQQYLKRKTSLAKKSGLIFPPSRVRKVMEMESKKYKLNVRIAKGATVYLASILEYILCQIIEISGNIAGIKNILKVEDIKKAIKDDEEIRLSLCKLDVSFD